jgi:hypothetical protein
MAKHEHYQVGDIIRYEHDGGEHEHTVHGVRYEEADGRRINIRYIISLEYLDHDIPLPDHIWHKDGKSAQARKALAAYHEEIIKSDSSVEKRQALGAEVDKYTESDPAIVQMRIDAHKAAHDHSVLCPIIEREVAHEKAIEKTGQVEIPIVE